MTSGVPTGRKGRPSRLAVSAGFKALVLDHLRDIEGLVDRAMFGGIGLYCGEAFFGIIAADVLYLQVDETSRKEFERQGMTPFMPFPGRPPSRRYFAVPMDIVESPLDLAQWARRAIQRARDGSGAPAARRTRAAAPPRKRRGKER